MTHTKALELVTQYAPQQAGTLWNTTERSGCDLAWAIADQYADDEAEHAVSDLQTIAEGRIPADWEPLFT